MNALLKAAAEVQEFLKEQGWSFMVIGGLAVQVWGRVRATRDVDISVAVGLDERGELAENASKRFKLLPDDPVKFIKAQNVLPIEAVSGVTIDLVCAWTDFELEGINRAVDIQVEPGFTMTVCTAEDLTLMKFISDRPRDREDVEGILIRTGAEMDHGYVRSWLTRFAESLDRSSLVKEYDECLKSAKG